MKYKFAVLTREKNSFARALTPQRRTLFTCKQASWDEAGPVCSPRLRSSVFEYRFIVMLRARHRRKSPQAQTVKTTVRVSGILHIKGKL